MERFAIIIPARYQSTRYPGKPLACLKGAGGSAKSLIQRTWECANSVTGHSGVWVATDDTRIADAVESLGGKVIMTSPDCRNGTERCAEAIEKIGISVDIVVNLQGDAPLTPNYVLAGLVKALENDTDADMATPAIRCSASLYAHLVNDQAAGRVGGTTVAFNSRKRALYFSKRVIPYIADSADHGAVHLHLGAYAYRPRALAAYIAAPPSQLELLEGLEQLRFLDRSQDVLVVPFDPIPWDCIELNNPSDIASIEAVLLARGLA